MSIHSNLFVMHTLLHLCFNYKSDSDVDQSLSVINVVYKIGPVFINDT